MGQLAQDPRSRRRGGRPAWIAVVATLLITMPAGSSTVGTDAADEHRWPGALRDGVSAETGIADSWPESGPRIVWRRSVGAGFSGIAVDGGRAFTLDQ